MKAINDGFRIGTWKLQQIKTAKQTNSRIDSIIFGRPKTGSIKKKFSKHINCLFVCCFCIVYICFVFIIYYWPKIANSGLGVDSNHILNVFGACQFVATFGALDPLFITEIFTTSQEHTISY